MPVKLGTLIEKQLKKVGIDTTTDEFKALIALDTDVPDDIASKLDKGLLTLDAAKNNSEVIKAIKATTLAGADSKIDEIITELGLQPDEAFAANKNTYEKIGLLSKLANEAGKKAAGAGNKTTAAEWADKEADYNKQIRDLKTAQTAKETEIAGVQKSAKTTSRIERRILAQAKQLNLPDDMDIDLKIAIVTGAINGDIQKKGLRWELDENDNLIVVDKDGKPAYNPNDNVAYEPNKLIDGALAQNKLLKINDVNPQQNIISGASVINATGGGLSAIRSEYLQQVSNLPE